VVDTDSCCWVSNAIFSFNGNVTEQEITQPLSFFKVVCYNKIILKERFEMGCYVTPQSDKLIWLNTHGLNLPGPLPLRELPSDCSLVCLVDNGPFTAAAICLNERDYAEFTDARDNRPKRWYICENSDLAKVSNLMEYLKF
jgi:hypothetical protein